MSLRLLLALALWTGLPMTAAAGSLAAQATATARIVAPSGMLGQRATRPDQPAPSGLGMTSRSGQIPPRMLAAGHRLGALRLTGTHGDRYQIAVPGTVIARSRAGDRPLGLSGIALLAAPGQGLAGQIGPAGQQELWLTGRLEDAAGRALLPYTATVPILLSHE